MTYEIMGLDICVQGFERLRNQDEFILVTYVYRGTTSGQMRCEYIADIQSCAREDGFDYDAARKAVNEYFDECDNDIQRTLDRLDFEETEDEDAEGLIAPLYIKVS